MTEQTTTLHIKNMVCPRCIMAVRQCLADAGLQPLSVGLGTAVLAQSPAPDALERLRTGLEALGFELLDDPRLQLVEQLKNAVIEQVHYADREPLENLSDYLSRRFHREYSALSKLFSEQTGTTLERYAIAQKIERAKELLAYGELNLNEIADRLGYSSAAYLSTQFKAVTGLTPTAYRQARDKGRKPLDTL